MTKEVAEIGALKRAVGDWATAHMQVLQFDAKTLEVATPLKDSLGEPVYCFIEKMKGQYSISDEGRMLFKLDPSASDQEIYQMAAEIIASADFEFNQDNGVISKLVDEDELVQELTDLAQLQVAVSYLG